MNTIQEAYILFLPFALAFFLFAFTVIEYMLHRPKVRKPMARTLTKRQLRRKYRQHLYL